MILFMKRQFQAPDSADSGNPEVAIFAAQVAPGNQMPIESVKNKAYRLYCPQAAFVIIVDVIQFYHCLG